jgi:hypothetical protein
MRKLKFGNLTVDINLNKCQWEDIRLTPNKIKQFEDITLFFLFYAIHSYRWLIMIVI